MELQDMRSRIASDSQSQQTTHSAAPQSPRPSSAGSQSHSRNTSASQSQQSMTESQSEQSRTGSQIQQNRHSTGELDSHRSRSSPGSKKGQFRNSTGLQSQSQTTREPLRPGQVDGTAGLSDDGQRVHDSADGVADRTEGGMGSCGQRAPGKESSANHMKAPISNRKSEGAENTQRHAADAVTENSKDRQNSSTGFGRLDEGNLDKTDGILGRREANNYECLDRGRDSSQHLYRPIIENSKPRTAGRATNNSKPSASSASTNRATSPLYDSCAVEVLPTDTDNSKPSTSCAPANGATSPIYDSCAVQVLPAGSAKSESHPFLQQPSRQNHFAENADDIIELQSDDQAVSSREESQNKFNAKRENPEMTNVPNTNFAIACMVALCFNLPFGVLAMYFSLRAVKAYQEGRAKLGERRSRWSIVVSLLGITITTVIVSSVVLYIATLGQRRISRHRVYGSKSGLNL